MRRPLAIGTIAGIAGSVVPWELVFLAMLAIGLFLFVRLLWPVQMGCFGYFIGAAMAIATMTAAAWIPVKELDRRVGPMRYEAMRMDRLADAMREDWKVYLFTTSRRVVSFHTDEPMSRRAVLDKLARDTDMGLFIHSCGNGASLLFGGFSGAIITEKRPEPISAP